MQPRTESLAEALAPGMDRQRTDQFVKEQNRKSASPLDSSLFQEPVIVAHQQERLHLAHRIQEHPDRDEHRGASEKLRDGVVQVQESGHQGRNEGDDDEEYTSSEGDSVHDPMKCIGSRLPRPYSRNVATVFLQIIGDLELIELGGDPKIGEKEDHQRLSREVEPARVAEKRPDLDEDLQIVHLSEFLE